jgi:hypothetical protein
MWGAANETHITQLGLIVQNTTCTAEELLIYRLAIEGSKVNDDSS